MATKLLHYTTWPSGLGGRKDLPPPSLSFLVAPPHQGTKQVAPHSAGKGLLSQLLGIGLRKEPSATPTFLSKFSIKRNLRKQEGVGGNRGSSGPPPALCHYFPSTLQHIGITCSGNWVSRRACAPESLDVFLLMDEKQFVFEHILTWAKFLSTIEVSSRGRAECVPAKVNT